MKKLLVATRNLGKLKEIDRLCRECGISVLGLDSFPSIPEITEDGASFAANAIKKAETVSRATGLPVLADDSGLVVEALAGRPGIHSARYAGPKCSDADNNHKLLQELKGLPKNKRRAAFHCVMALCIPGKSTRIYEGRVSGLILAEPRGEGGFGYDPLFMLPDYGHTMAELPLDQKNRISHRGQALRLFIEDLSNLDL